uniref:Uncharacterized protein n=1 Tax=Rhizophora mucronata TaxID=61149 RepID=A0A2P2NBV6_RHIMU
MIKMKQSQLLYMIILQHTSQISKNNSVQS